MQIEGFDPELFLQDYWQKKPLVIRQAVPSFSDPIEPEELAGLACEEPVESRLVFTGPEGWRIQQGPFREEDFVQLPDSDWTLMVQSVDQWLPELSALFSLVDFLPAWRRDDLMISYATPDSGVGPHFDFYDVFILQGQGCREWKLGQQCTAATELDNSSGLKILKEFRESDRFELHSGDLLYIPPGLAHYGISVDNSLSYSLGFRAPSTADMLIGISDELADGLNDHNRFQDITETLAAGGYIPESVFKQISHSLITLIQKNPAAIANWFGSVMTSSRYPEESAADPRIAETAQITQLASQSLLIRNPGARLAWSQAPSREQQLQVFTEGDYFYVPDTAAVHALLSMIDTTAPGQPIDIKSAALDDNEAEIISALYRHGFLVTDSDMTDDEFSADPHEPAH